MKKEAILVTLLLPLLQAAAQQPDAESIMNKSRELSIIGSLSAAVHLTITEKNGSSRNRTISMLTKSYPDGLEKRLVKFTEPADVRGTAMLVVDNRDIADEMWIYLPALKKTRRIVTTEKGKSFMSSEFSNADMSSPPLGDFKHKHLEKSGSDNLWIIESIPVNDDKQDEYGFSRKISYVSMEKNQVQKMEFYNFDNELFKIIEIKSIFPLERGKYLVKDMMASNLITGRKSEILFSDIHEGIVVEESNFSFRNLEK
jgi:hypothetical protein